MISDATEIRIRPYRPDDVEPLYKAAKESVSGMQPWLPWCHLNYSMRDAETGVEKQCQQWTSGQGYSFVIESDGGRFLGGCGLNQLNHIHLAANVGYWLRTSARGRGSMTCAIKLLRDFAFKNTEFDRLEIRVAVGNHASQRVAERVGGVREGLLREALLLNDERHDAILYSLLRSDPKH